MQKVFLFLATTFIFGSSYAQQQLLNPGFETWENEGTATMEPTHWSSLKTADALASLAPEVLSRDAGRNGGYSAVLEVKSAFGIAANGLLTNGRVHADMNPENGYVYTDASQPEWNTPFTQRPDSLVGWFKYEPKSGDKGKIEVILHQGTVGKLPIDATTQANMVGHLRYDITTPSTQWIRFSAPFNYTSSANPDYILVTIACGDSTVSKAGTKLWIDDLELIYNEDEGPSGIKNPNALSSLYHIYAANGFIYFDSQLKEKDTYQIIELSGKVIQEGNIHSQIPFQAAAGLYLVRVQTSKGYFSKKVSIR